MIAIEGVFTIFTFVLMKGVWALLLKDLKLEWRLKYALSGLFLYLFCTVFVVFFSFRPFTDQLEDAVLQPIWTTLYWIITLFVAINAIVKSFVQETGDRKYYYNQIATSLEFYFSKLIYNTLLLIIACGLTYLFMGLLFTDPVTRVHIFILIMVSGAVSLAICLTFVSIIANQTTQSSTTMAILAFPVILPVLLTLIRMTVAAFDIRQAQEFSSDLTILLAVDMLLLGLSLWLFPFVWKD